MLSTSAPIAADRCASAGPCLGDRRRAGRSGATAHDREPARQPSLPASPPNRCPHRMGAALATKQPAAPRRAPCRRLARCQDAIRTADRAFRRCLPADQPDRDVLATVPLGSLGRTTPIAPAARGSVQSGFNEVAHRAKPASVSHDLTEASRFRPHGLIV